MKTIKILVILGVIGVTFIVFSHYIYKIDKSNEEGAPSSSGLYLEPKKGTFIRAERSEMAAVTLLNHAFWLLHSEYNFSEENSTLLENIAKEYKKFGKDEKYKIVHGLYLDYKNSTRRLNYDPLYPNMEYAPNWSNVKKLIDAEKLDEAVEMSKNDAYSLSKIASAYYKKDGNHARAMELLEMASKQIPAQSEYKDVLWNYVANGYVDIGEYQKAYQILMNSNKDFLPGYIALPIIKNFVDMDDFDRAFDLLSKVRFKDVQAEALIYIANKMGNDKPLSPQYEKILSSMLK